MVQLNHLENAISFRQGFSPHLIGDLKRILATAAQKAAERVRVGLFQVIVSNLSSSHIGFRSRTTALSVNEAIQYRVKFKVCGRVPRTNRNSSLVLRSPPIQSNNDWMY
jgi:hypothetical protein